MVNSCGRNGIFSDFCGMNDVSPTILLSLPSHFILTSKQQKQWISQISMCWSGNIQFFHQDIMLQILGCGWGMQFPNPEWFMCGRKPMANWSYSNQKWRKPPKTPRPGLEMSGHPCSGRKELCINPAVGMKSTRIIVWRTSKCWDLPWWLWSSLYNTLKELWGKYIPSAPQEREAIL